MAEADTRRGFAHHTSQPAWLGADPAMGPRHVQRPDGAGLQGSVLAHGRLYGVNASVYGWVLERAVSPALSCREMTA